MTGPTAAKGRFPYNHRTVAEVDAGSPPNDPAGDAFAAMLEHFTGCKVVDVTPRPNREPRT